MSTSSKTSTTGLEEKITPVLFDGSAFFLNLLAASIGGWILGIILVGVILAHVWGSGGVLAGLLGLLFWCLPAFFMGYIALRKFDQNTAKWTWAAGLLAWAVLITIDLATFDGKYCGLNRWQHLWVITYFPIPRGNRALTRV